MAIGVKPSLSAILTTMKELPQKRMRTSSSNALDLPIVSAFVRYHVLRFQEVLRSFEVESVLEAQYLLVAENKLAHR
jgi:hypothetical protein